MKSSDDSSYLRRLLLTGLLIVGFGLFIGMVVKLLTTNNFLGSVPNISDQTLPTAVPTPDPSSPLKPIEEIIKATPTEPAQPDVITLKEFNQIQPDMTFKQVEEVVGTKGKLISSSQAGGVKSELYSWQNQQGSNALIDFRNDRVSSKAQSGLN